MKDGFTVQAILTKCNLMVDGGLSVGFHTKELTAEEKAMVMEYHNEPGWLLFKTAEISETDLPKGDVEVDGKTPSQRLRAVLYILWKQTSSEDDFETYYRNMMEKFIDHIKGKLD